MADSSKPKRSMFTISHILDLQGDEKQQDSNAKITDNENTQNDKIFQTRVNFRPAAENDSQPSNDFQLISARSPNDTNRIHRQETYQQNDTMNDACSSSDSDSNDSDSCLNPTETTSAGDIDNASHKVSDTHTNLYNTHNELFHKWLKSTFSRNTTTHGFVDGHKTSFQSRDSESNCQSQPKPTNFAEALSRHSNTRTEPFQQSEIPSVNSSSNLIGAPSSHSFTHHIPNILPTIGSFPTGDGFLPPGASNMSVMPHHSNFGAISAQVMANHVTSDVTSGLWIAQVQNYINRQLLGLNAPKPIGRRSRRVGVDRKPRQAYSSKQLTCLEAEFKHDKYLSVSKRLDLSQSLDLSETQIKTWFQNRRTKWKKQMTARLKAAQRQGLLSSFWHAHPTPTLNPGLPL